jgi:hypothetical protein
MIGIDVMIWETGSGGNIKVQNNDLVVVNGYENMPYLSMYEGNDSWMDDLLLTGDQKHQATTEVVIAATTLNSTGRGLIEEAMSNDLDDLAKISSSTKSVAVAIAAKNRINADIQIAGQNIRMNFNPDSLFLEYALL